MQDLWRDFEQFYKEEIEKTCDFSTRVVEIVNQIRGNGIIQEKKIVEKVIRSLPQKFDYVVAVL